MTGCTTYFDGEDGYDRIWRCNVNEHDYSFERLESYYDFRIDFLNQYDQNLEIAPMMKVWYTMAGEVRNIWHYHVWANGVHHCSQYNIYCHPEGYELERPLIGPFYYEYSDTKPNGLLVEEDTLSFRIADDQFNDQYQALYKVKYDGYLFFYNYEPLDEEFLENEGYSYTSFK